MDLKQQTVDTYNATAKTMADKFNSIGARVEDVDRGFSFLEKENPFVLEIGCGNGRDAIEVLKHTDKYLGIDISEQMIKIAGQTAPKGKFVVADVEKCIFPDSVDLIFSFASLLHSDKEAVKQIIYNAGQALSSGGVFYISLKYGHGQTTKTDEFGTRTYYLYTPEDIKKFANDLYEVIYEDVHELRGQKWFTIALKKKS